jgi:hypothetical protein
LFARYKGRGDGFGDPFMDWYSEDKSRKARVDGWRAHYQQEKGETGVNMVCEEYYVRLVNQTYSKMCSQKQTLPKIVSRIAEKRDKILDFGAGKDAFGTKCLRERGFDVTAYEIGKNFVEGVHDPKALDSYYSIIFASNVLNVQPDVPRLLDVISDVKAHLKCGGVFICNFPVKPRHNDATTDFVETALRLAFNREVQVIENHSPTWMCEKLERWEMIDELLLATIIIVGAIDLVGVVVCMVILIQETLLYYRAEHPKQENKGRKKTWKLNTDSLMTGHIHAQSIAVARMVTV